MRRFVLFFAAVSIVAPIFVAKGFALRGLNQCGPGTSPPEGVRCRSDQLLLGYRNPAGACLWVCCPPNGDGESYDCSGEATPSDYRSDLRAVRPGAWSGGFVPHPSLQKEDAEP